MMTFMQACFLFGAGVLSGGLNAIAGGGGLILFPALIFAGLPPVQANATSTSASWPGHVAAIAAYRKDLVVLKPMLWLFLLIGLTGGLAGACLLLFIPAPAFRQLVPYLLLVSTLIFAFSDQLSRWSRFQSSDSQPQYWRWQGWLLVFLVAMYGGFYGLGVSFLLLALFGLLGIHSTHQINGLKTFQMACIDGIAITTFMIANVIVWPQALVMAGGIVLGSSTGSRFAHHLEPKTIKRFVVAVGCVLTLYFFTQI
jgi:uncharacterized protein